MNSPSFGNDGRLSVGIAQHQRSMLWRAAAQVRRAKQSRVSNDHCTSLAKPTAYNRRVLVRSRRNGVRCHQSLVSRSKSFQPRGSQPRRGVSHARKISRAQPPARKFYCSRSGSCSSASACHRKSTHHHEQHRPRIAPRAEIVLATSSRGSRALIRAVPPDGRRARRGSRSSVVSRALQRKDRRCPPAGDESLTEPRSSRRHAGSATLHTSCGRAG